MRKIFAVVITILVGIGGCKSLDCGCPMAIERGQESGVRGQFENTVLTPDTCSLTPTNSTESHPHFHQRICTD